MVDPIPRDKSLGHTLEDGAVSEPEKRGGLSRSWWTFHWLEIGTTTGSMYWSCIDKNGTGLLRKDLGPSTRDVLLILVSFVHNEIWQAEEREKPCF